MARSARPACASLDTFFPVDSPSCGPEVLDVIDLPDPVPGDGEQLYEVTAAGINLADTHQTLSRDLDQEGQRH
jgi:NADPH:quinone reductase-like Zn-dependent oxidoreductase